MSKETPEIYLEPRVAKLEVGLDRLTDDVRNLVTVVRDQGSQMEQEIQKLVIAVTQASGPRKTDWGTIIAGLALILAIGSAVFWPLNQISQDNKTRTEQLSEIINTHQKLDMHPVGLALVQRLEAQFLEHQNSNRRELENHLDDEKAKHFAIADTAHNEMDSIRKTHELEIAALKEKTQMHDDRLYGRVVKLEDRNTMEIEREKDELQMWRLKAMGLDVPVGTPGSHSHTTIDQKSETFPVKK